jgi:hypothetical protein
MSHHDTSASQAIILEPTLALDTADLQSFMILEFFLLWQTYKQDTGFPHVALQQAVSAGSMPVHAAVGCKQLCQSRTGAQCS